MSLTSEVLKRVVETCGIITVRLPVHDVLAGGGIQASDDAITAFFRSSIIPLGRASAKAVLFGLQDLDASDMEGEGALLEKLITPGPKGQHAFDFRRQEVEELKLYALRNLKLRWVPARSPGAPRERAKTRLGVLLLFFSEIAPEMKEILGKGTFLFAEPDAKRQVGASARKSIDAWLATHTAGSVLLINPEDIVCFLGVHARGEMAQHLLGACAFYPELQDPAEWSGLDRANAEALIESEVEKFRRRFES